VLCAIDEANSPLANLLFEAVLPQLLGPTGALAEPVGDLAGHRGHRYLNEPPDTDVHHIAEPHH
jgi:hypothetical protein